MLVRIGYIGSTHGVNAKPTPRARNNNGVHQLSAKLVARLSCCVTGADEGVSAVDDFVAGGVTAGVCAALGAVVAVAESEFDEVNTLIGITRVSGG